MIPVSAYTQSGAVALTGVKLVRTYGTNLKISWNPSLDEYHKKYRVYRSDDNFATDGTLLVTTSKTDFTDKDAGTGTWYYMVKDVDSFDIESDDSAVVTTTVGALLPFVASLNITSATVINFMTQIERLAMEGSVENKGPEDLLVELSYDGTTYPKNITLEPYDIMHLDDAKNRIAIHSIRLTSTDSNISMVVT